MIKIDKGVPKPNGRGGAPAKYPWQLMEIGDSFFVSDVATKNCRYGTAAARFGIKISTHKWSENGVSGVRVWRIA